jgi:hypothetical protein
MWPAESGDCQIKMLPWSDPDANSGICWKYAMTRAGDGLGKK